MSRDWLFAVGVQLQLERYLRTLAIDLHFLGCSGRLIFLIFVGKRWHLLQQLNRRAVDQQIRSRVDRYSGSFNTINGSLQRRLRFKFGVLWRIDLNRLDGNRRAWSDFDFVLTALPVASNDFVFKRLAETASVFG